MIIDLKRSIDLRWMFDPVLLFILRWSCFLLVRQVRRIRRRGTTACTSHDQVTAHLILLHSVQLSHTNKKQKDKFDKNKNIGLNPPLSFIKTPFAIPPPPPCPLITTSSSENIHRRREDCCWGPAMLAKGLRHLCIFSFEHMGIVDFWHDITSLRAIVSFYGNFF